MKLRNEEQLLDAGFRSKVIAEIVDTENKQRKHEELRKYQIYRDKIRFWVIESLKHEGLKGTTLASMQNRAANINICKKVVNKLAQAYSNGAIRELEDKKSQQSINELAKELDVNTKLKKVDRYIQLFRNTVLQIIPEASTRESQISGKPKRNIKFKVLPPYLYDVIEDEDDKELPRVYILTDFIERHEHNVHGITSDEDGRSSFFHGRHLGAGHHQNVEQGDRKDQIIADNRADQGVEMRTFIWWSDRFHFTTDGDGKIIRENGISPEDLANPIGLMPFVNFSEDQDGQFWAEGGDDLVEGCILINKLLTDLFSIAYTQGWGQGVATGKDIPKTLEGGPHNWLIFDRQDKDDPETTFQFVTANPPISDWLTMIEQYVALYLSTQNLSPRNVANSLSGQTAASGIMLLIEQSESTVDVRDRQKMFKDKEPLVWEIVRRWFERLKAADALVKDLEGIDTFASSDVNVLFPDSKPVITETEKLANIEKRKTLGINTMVDLVLLDNPDLTPDQAEEKLAEIVKEKATRLVNAQMLMTARSIDGVQTDQETPKEEADQEEVAEDGNEES